MTNPPPTHVAGWFAGHHAVNPVVDGIGMNKIYDKRYHLTQNSRASSVNFAYRFFYSRNASYSANTLADTKADCRSASGRITTSTYSANPGSTTAAATTTATTATATHRSASASAAGIVVPHLVVVILNMIIRGINRLPNINAELSQSFFIYSQLTWQHWG